MIRTPRKNSVTAKVLSHLTKCADENGVFSNKDIEKLIKEGVTNNHSSSPNLWTTNLFQAGYVKRVGRGVYQLKWNTVRKLMSMKLI